MMENSYCPLIEQVFSEIAKGTEIVEEFDKFHYFKLSRFMIEVCRLKAYDQHKKDKIEALKVAQA